MSKKFEIIILTLVTIEVVMADIVTITSLVSKSYIDGRMFIIFCSVGTVLLVVAWLFFVRKYKFAQTIEQAMAQQNIGAATQPAASEQAEAAAQPVASEQVEAAQPVENDKTEAATEKG